MKKILISAIFVFTFLAPAGRSFAAAAVAYPGDTVLVAVPDNHLPVTAVTFGGAPASTFVYQGIRRAMAGVPLTKAPGVYNLRVKFSGAADFVKPVWVKPKKFPVVLLPVPEKLQETPQQLVTNLQSSNAAVQKDVEIQTPGIYFSVPFGLPLSDNSRITSPFGEIRKTGPEIIRHLGVDFGAKTGAPVGAINAGVVKKSYLDPTYGNSVIIDHGQGIYSLYLHLNERDVAEGDRVQKGTLIGRVGETGLASAPHLHLSVKINGVAVDPIRFVKTVGF